MATEATDAAAQAGHAAGEAASHGGMPQLDFATYPNQIFWLVIALVAVWWILSRIALPRIGAVLAERAGTVTNDLAAAEELSLKVKDAEAAYDRALVEARHEAAKIVDRTRAEIKAELDAATARADAEIAVKSEELAQAIAEVRASAAQSVREVALATAAEIVAAMGGKADAAAVAAAVDAKTKG